jgi:hypothetical protein
MLNSRIIKCFLIPALLLTLTCKTTAQDENDFMQVNGILWKTSGDTIYGNIQYINQFYFQFSVTLVDSAGTPTQSFSPGDLEGFIYYIENDTVEYISINNPTDLGRLFLRLMYRGKLLMYQFLELDMKSSELTYKVSYYLWDKKWLYPPISIEYETESLLYHFSDCPELEYKIKSGTYRLSQIRAILHEYEHCKKTDTYEYFFE